MSGYCGSCRFWRQYGSKVYYKIPPGKGVCVLAASECGDPVQVKTKAFAADYDSRAADLVTAGDFGCIEFDGRPAREGE